MQDEDDDENPRPSLGTLLFFLGVVLFLIAFAHWERGCQRAHADELMTRDPLVLAVMDLQPTLSYEQAEQHVTWARAAVAGTPFKVERILGIAQAESSFDKRSVSRLECSGDVCQRVLGPLLTWSSRVKGPYFCGVMQVRAKHSRRECDRLRNDIPGNYLAGVAALTFWHNHPLCRRRADKARMYCALLGYGGGKPLILLGEHRYPGKVERRMERVEKLVAAHAAS
jgi:hypothetical protein